jgi:hypothetical protein
VVRKRTSSRETLRVALALTAALCLACGGATPRGPTIALLGQASDADAAELDARVHEAEAHLPVVLERRTLAPRVPSEAVAAYDFASVRAAYDDGELDRCIAALPDDAAVARALERGDRMEASRALYWRMACLRALGRVDEAAAVAHEHAVRALPIPPDVGAANATAETLLRDAHRDVSALAPVRVQVASEPAGARIAVDGAPTERLTPAELDLPAGAHLLTLSLPTYAAESVEIVASEDAAPIALTLTLLEPEPALAALHDSLDAGEALDADVSLALLATALRARSLVLVTRDADRLRAALIGTGDAEGMRTIVRGERVGEHTDDVEGLLRDLFVRGRLVAPPPAFYELPELWIAVAAAVAIGVGVTLGLTLQPDVHTRVVLP